MSESSTSTSPSMLSTYERPLLSTLHLGSSCFVSMLRISSLVGGTGGGALGGGAGCLLLVDVVAWIKVCSDALHACSRSR